MQSYQCIIVGGGIAGLQAAIQLGRYNHDVLVVDKGEGRSSLCRCYHNVLGWPDGVEGEKLRTLGKQHAEKYHVKFLEDNITEINRKEGYGFRLKGNDEYEAKYLLIATGVSDNIPLKLPNLKECLGLTIYICPDCDGYEVTNKKVIVTGSGDSGANMALTLLHWTNDIIYINSGASPISSKNIDFLTNKGIEIINEQVVEVEIAGPGQFKGFVTKSGMCIKGERGFLAFGGNKVNTDLLQDLGVERLENHHVNTNARTKETNIRNVWVAGDIGVHSELLTIAMGEGAQAAIWIHKRILEDGD
ncbi:NAD(P)/FAD-dependent oxidoreductase [Bacillus suaedaesalsae]|uniref:NAD(P)/FAD-dependent oxidoreductase n=1 Tax=Bacillus suaedaesalsae TaxID=2810349 RepID=A0ABS2DLK6_9BACI|nr:NAD(P)/FAD-dependent oxidoreductase [Bacillus suaedaesalsae]MBM6619367.1 NAD(P)/FAD-dependent oxidoreductase [Bacillus suaedaesalsae]